MGVRARQLNFFIARATIVAAIRRPFNASLFEYSRIVMTSQRHCRKNLEASQKEALKAPTTQSNPSVTKIFDDYEKSVVFDAGTNGVLPGAGRMLSGAGEGLGTEKEKERTGGIDREGDGVIGIGAVEIAVAGGIVKISNWQLHTIGGAVVGGGEGGGVNGAGDFVQLESDPPETATSASYEICGSF